MKILHFFKSLFYSKILPHPGLSPCYDPQVVLWSYVSPTFRQWQIMAASDLLQWLCGSVVHWYVIVFQEIRCLVAWRKVLHIQRHFKMNLIFCSTLSLAHILTCFLGLRAKLLHKSLFVLASLCVQKKSSIYYALAHMMPLVNWIMMGQVQNDR